MLAGREGNGTVLHFLGSTRNSQGEFLTLDLLCVCVCPSLSLSSLACLFLTLFLLLSAAIPGGEHHQAGRSPGKSNQSRRLITVSEPPGGSLVPVSLLQALPAAKIPQPGVLL